MKTPVFEGSSVAIVTPFKSSGEINFNELERLIERQIENKTDAITICGTTGEASTIEKYEVPLLFKFTKEVVNNRIPIIAGTGSNNTKTSLELANIAEMNMCQAVLLVTPYYNKTNQNGLISHYNFIANNISIPSILYNVPSRTGMSLDEHSYYKLSKNENINGVKEASGDFSLVAKTIAMCEDNLNIWSGNDDQTVALMSLGAKGVISVFANVFPSVSHDIAELCKNGDFKSATSLQSEYIEIINALFKDVNPIPVKKALEHLGFNTKTLRMPLFETSDTLKDELRVLLNTRSINIKA